MQRATIIAFLLCTLLLTTATLLGIAQANPYGAAFPTETSPPASVNIDVKAQSPIENATYQNGTVQMSFNVTLNDSPNHFSSLFMVFYKGDWMQDRKWCPFMTESNIWLTDDFLEFNFNITDVPAGRHSIAITPTAQGTYVENGKPYTFQFNKTVTINFLVQPQTTSSSVPTPAVPELQMVVVAGLLIVASVLLVYFKRREKLTSKQSQ
jgi:hypothetical protein